MSNETIAKGVLGFSVDHTEVEAGVAKIERSLADLGKSAQSAGTVASQGIDKLSDAAERSAAVTKRATEQKISAIQRQIAAEMAGAKSGAAFEAQLANIRGADYAAALDPYIKQLMAAERETEKIIAANKQMADSQRFLANLKGQTDSIGKSSADLAEQKAAMLGVAEAAAPMIAKLRNVETSTNGLGISAKQTAAALRGVPAQFTDIFVSLQGGQRPLSVFLQQGGQLKDMFGGAGEAAKALGSYVLGLINPFTIATGAVVGLASAYYAGSEESSRLSKALIMSGNFAGGSVGQFTALATEVGKSTNNFGLARDSIEELAASGVISSALIEDALKGVVAGAELTGRSAKSLVSDFENIAKDPAKAIASLNEKYNFLTFDIYKQIKALQEQGKTQDAANLATKTYADTLEQRRAEVVNNLGAIEKGWKAIKDAAHAALDATLDVGREQTDEQRLAELRLKLSAKVGRSGQSVLSHEKRYTRGGVLPSEFEAVEAEANRLEASIKARTEAAAKASQFAAEQKKQVEKLDALNEYAKADSRQTIADKLAEENKKFAEVTQGFSHQSDEYQRALKAHVAAIAKIKEPETNKAAAAAQKELNAYDSLISSIKQKATEANDQIGTDAKLTDSQKIRIKLNEDLASGVVKLTAAHKANVLAELDSLAVSEKLLQADKLRKEITEFNASNAAKVKERTDELTIEYQLYGKTNDARDIAIIGLRNQAEVEKEIQKLKKQGFDLSDQQIQQLRDEADARSRVEESTLGQMKALAYAKQLDDENKQFALDSIFDDKERAAAQVKIEEKMWQERIRLAGDGTQAQLDLMASYSKNIEYKLNKPLVDEWKKTVANYDQIFREGFANMVNGGKGTWKSFTKSLATTFKTTVADYIYNLLARPFVIKIAASLLGIGTGSAVGSAAQIAGSATGSSGSISQIFGSIKDGIGSLNSNVVGSIESLGANIADGMGGIRDTIGGYLGENASLVSNALSYTGAVLQLAQGNIAGAVGTAIGTYFGGPVGGAIGSAIGSVIGGAFGGGGHKETYAFANSMVSADATKIVSNSISKGDGGGAGGYDVGIKYANFLGDAIRNLAKSFSGTIDEAFTLGASYSSKYQNINAFIDNGGARKGYGDVFFDLGKGQEQNAAAQAFFVAVKKGLVTLPDVLEDIIRRSDVTLTNSLTSVTSLQQIAAMNDALSDLPPIFKSIGVAIKTITLADGDALKSRFDAINTYTGLFYSDSEKVETFTKQMTTSFGKLGLALPDTRDGFRQLVDGIDTTTDSGLALFNTLIGMAPTLDTYYKALQAQSDATKQAANDANALIEALTSDKFKNVVDFTRYQRVSDTFGKSFANGYVQNLPGANSVPSNVVGINDGQAAVSNLQNLTNNSGQVNDASNQELINLLTDLIDEVRSSNLPQTIALQKMEKYLNRIDSEGVILNEENNDGKRVTIDTRVVA